MYLDRLTTFDGMKNRISSAWPRMQFDVWICNLDHVRRSFAISVCTETKSDQRDYRYHVLHD